MVKKSGKCDVLLRTSDLTYCMVTDPKTGKEKPKMYLTMKGKYDLYGVELKAKENRHIGKDTFKKLSPSQAGYRLGYRAAVREQSRIYKRKHKK